MLAGMTGTPADPRGASATRAATRAIGAVRIGVAGFVVFVVLTSYAERIASGDGNPFDYFGYFTNQTSLGVSVVLISTGALLVTGRTPPRWLTTARAIGTSYLLIVAVIYNTLVPGTGSAPAWVSALLHLAFPLAVALDWALIGDRPPLPWRRLWIVLPYPLVWLAIVLLRGISDGWVPYGFLLPERGALSLIGSSSGLLLALLAAGSLVWAASRLPGALLNPEAPSPPDRRPGTNGRRSARG